MTHKREILTKKERHAQTAFMAKLDVKKRKTDTPLIVATIGLVGSGKSTVAREFAKRIGATVIDGDEIRVELRRQHERYEDVQIIAEHAIFDVVKRGGNVILGSDLVNKKKRTRLDKNARILGARVVFIRTICDIDVMVGRALTSTYHNRVDDFFGGAKSSWKGSDSSKGAVVKIREMWRRTPHHYRWVNKNGGQWDLKAVPFTIFAEIDTTDSSSWKRAVKSCAKQLLMR